MRQLVPSSSAARLDLAERLASQGRVAEAEGEVRAALTAEPELAAAHYGLGVVLAAGGRTYEAVAALRRARELAPEDAEVLNNLGYLVGELGEFTEAEALLEEARRRSPCSLAPPVCEQTTFPGLPSTSHSNETRTRTGPFQRGWVLNSAWSF